MTLKNLLEKRMKNSKGYNCWFASDVCKLFGYDSKEDLMVILQGVELPQNENFFYEELPINDYLLSSRVCEMLAVDDEQKAYFSSIIKQEELTLEIIKINSVLEKLEQHYYDLIQYKLILRNEGTIDLDNLKLSIDDIEDVEDETKKLRSYKAECLNKYFYQ